MEFETSSFSLNCRSSDVSDLTSPDGHAVCLSGHAVANMYPVLALGLVIDPRRHECRPIVHSPMIHEIGDPKGDWPIRARGSRVESAKEE